jgi:uncharacterized protein (TIGR02466 family)
MPIKSYFATPIAIDPLHKKPSETARFNRDLLEQCYLVKATDPDGRDWSKENYLHGYTSYGSITDLHRRYPHFEELDKKIRTHVRRFARSLEMDLQEGRLEMSSCWVNIMAKSAAHTSHLHPLSVISGTYYVSIPKGASPLKFEDPRHAQFMAAPPKRADAKPRNQPFVTLAPRAGDVAIWESWLRHEVPPSRTREERVSISFNYEWK